MCLVNRDDGGEQLWPGEEGGFTEEIIPRGTSGITANDMSRTAETARFKSQQGALPPKLTGACQFGPSHNKRAPDRLSTIIFQLNFSPRFRNLQYPVRKSRDNVENATKRKLMLDALIYLTRLICVSKMFHSFIHSFIFYLFFYLLPTLLHLLISILAFSGWYRVNKVQAECMRC